MNNKNERIKEHEHTKEELEFIEKNKKMVEKIDEALIAASLFINKVECSKTTDLAALIDESLKLTETPIEKETSVSNKGDQIKNEDKIYSKRYSNVIKELKNLHQNSK